mmetsp:Transcript_17682/g.40014  ORF Transcript_17682/g.40014 Transcript_17682/m.40014 type:complete len:197 (-) Transcript_17682:28-618(-)
MSSSGGYPALYAAMVKEDVSQAPARVSRRILTMQLRTWLLGVSRIRRKPARLPQDAGNHLLAFLVGDQLPRQSAARFHGLADAACVAARASLDSAVADIFERLVLPQVTSAAENCRYTCSSTIRFNDLAVSRFVAAAVKLNVRGSDEMMRVAKEAGFSNVSTSQLDLFVEQAKNAGRSSSSGASSTFTACTISLNW